MNHEGPDQEQPKIGSTRAIGIGLICAAFAIGLVLELGWDLILGEGRTVVESSRSFGQVHVTEVTAYAGETNWTILLSLGIVVGVGILLALPPRIRRKRAS